LRVLIENSTHLSVCGIVALPFYGQVLGNYRKLQKSNYVRLYSRNLLLYDVLTILEKKLSIL